MLRKIFLLFFIFILLPPILAEQNGTINLTVVNASQSQYNVITTGLYGSIVLYCNAATDCNINTDIYRCANDYDSVSGTGYTGWCIASGNLSCVHDGTWYAPSTSPICYNTTVTRTCSSGNWTTTNCASGYICSGGTCSSNATTTTTSGGSTGTTTTTAGKTASITITDYPSNFNITQNQSVAKTITVKNNGQLSLYKVTLSISGFDWYTLSPTRFDNLSINSSASFIMTFSPPASANVKTYDVTASIATDNISVSASASFKINVLPSSETVTKDIIPNYEEYYSMLQSLKDNITELESKGANVNDLWNLYNSIKDKLNQTNLSIEKKDYFQANQLLNEIKNKLEDLKAEISGTTIPTPKGIDIIFIVIIIVVIIVIAVLLYMLWPARAKQWKPAKSSGKEESKVKSILEKMKKKKGEEKFKYEFRAK